MSAPPKDLVQGLSDPGAYPHRVLAVELGETHISWLFFAGERVYKVKKPVRFAFLDFSTPALRQRACEEEVRLNSRLAAEMYLGVVPLVRGPGGHWRVGGSGEALEHAVCMKRLPATRMLNALLVRGVIDNDLIEHLAQVLAGFHATADRGPEIARYGALEALRANVLANLEELGPFAGGPALSKALHGFLLWRARSFLEGHAELLERRVAEGRIRDGHGDLHAENICALEDGRLLIYDCIEFNPALRAGDVACDLAFLLMDLEQRGYPGFAAFLARRYGELAEDAELELLLPFYKAYRAAVRAKVALLGAPADPAAAARAARYLHLAAGYALAPPVVLLRGSEEEARRVAAGLQVPLRARLLDAAGASLHDLPHTLARERSALIALEEPKEHLAPALIDAAARLSRRVLELDAHELARLSPEAVGAAVIERLIELEGPPANEAAPGRRGAAGGGLGTRS